MGRVAILHPQACSKDNLFHTTMKSEILKNNRNSESPAAKMSKNLVVGQVKILKRGEALNESSTGLKELNNRNLSNDGASTSDKDIHKVRISGRRALPAKKKADTVIVSKKKMKTITECFAGSAFTDSPPPSSLPLPSFFRKDFVTAGEGDATTDLRRILGLSVC